METKEKNFEDSIEHSLLTEGGYVKGNMSSFDKTKALDMPVLLAFIQATQPKFWQRFVNNYGDGTEKQLYKVFQADVARYGLIHVLRNGIKDRGVPIRFCYFAPSSNLNPDLVERYNANVLTCTRQFVYSSDINNSIDVVLSLNGIPIIALELKNQFTNQSVENGKNQFMYDRNPKELIFNFNSRILVCFAVDLYEVAMTTELKSDKTYFLPFNQGSNGAGNIGDGGNPENPDGFPTSYLWENVLQRDMLMSILQRYISKQTTEQLVLVNGKKTSKSDTKIIFPRYHQLDVVEKLVAETKKAGSGHNYLLQHSAGSGKSNSIAWITYRLALLHDEFDKDIFQTVFVITDRRVLNRQLQETILSFEHLEGQIETITDKDNSTKLKDAINDGKKIIITTLHRFPIIYKELDTRSGKNFAIIVDEAHSSQSGRSAQKLKAALADTDEALKEFAEIEEKAEEAVKEDMDVLVEALLTQGQHKNLSFYAFTATPKPKTLQTFGIRKGEGFDAFHHYSMRQAIDEEFILDVLKFYTTFENSYLIAKKVSDNPTYEEPPALQAIKSFHDNHLAVMEKKVEIMVEKFREITLNKIGGKAKAMIVCPSRFHAVKYFMLIKEYNRRKGYADIKPMVAFSGSIEYNSVEYTESKLNSTDNLKISESQLPMYFNSELFNVLVVAEKYQTGFDEPLLQTMFVDKKLKGVKAVQTLSRLNRSYKKKVDTYVFDFVNAAEDIKKSFSTFYEDTLLDKPVDVNYVYTFKNDLKAFHLWNIEDEEKVFKIFAKKEQEMKDMGKLSNALKPVINAYSALSEEKQFKVRYLLKNFNRFYAYMAQIVRTFDKELYKTYIFTEFLYKFLPKNPHNKVNLDDKISLTFNKINETFSGAILLNPTEKDKTIKGESPKEVHKPETKKDLLDNIIEKINLMFHGQFTEADRIIIETIFDRLKEQSKQLKKQAKSNDAQMFENNIFPQVFDKVAQSCYMEQMDSFTKLFENEQFYKHVMTEIGKALFLSFRNENTKPKEYQLPEQEKLKAAEKLDDLPIS